VKFGISFTATHLNQAGALVHVYTDGSVHLNHGGTEMGQGLYIKVAQVVAEEFRSTSTASDHRDDHRQGAQHLGHRGLVGLRPQRHGGARTRRGRSRRGSSISPRRNGRCRRRASASAQPGAIGNRSRWPSANSRHAYMARVSLSATGFYKTPKIHWDRATGKGRPFFYFAYGAACAEVTIDTLTGEMRVDRVDILHDVGRSLNPAIDIGQIEGGFVQGMGWLTTEELVWDARGGCAPTRRRPTRSPAPPTCRPIFASGSRVAGNARTRSTAPRPWASRR
jgi:xanthine dehydrogenase large subunit